MFTQHPLQSGQLFSSLGGHFTYRVIGPCCRLFDREELPWPCCRLGWRGKEPSWRRIGKRLIADVASRSSPSYSVEILEYSYSGEPFVLTLHWVKLPQAVKDWWYARKPDSKVRGPWQEETSEGLKNLPVLIQQTE